MALLAGTVASLLIFDFVLAVRGLEYSLSSHLSVLAFFVICSIAYNFAVLAGRGSDDAIQWTTGWFLEWALSIDNLFFFHLIFQAFKVPDKSANLVLTLGIYG